MLHPFNVQVFCFLLNVLCTTESGNGQGYWRLAVRCGSGYNTFMLTIGHRGAAGLEPENTLRSFQRAIDLGCDMVELDVHVCKTGEVVVIHDATVDRTTNGHGRVADMTLAELQKLDAGKGERIPTLEEVFRLVDKKVYINVELKSFGSAEAVAKIVAQTEHVREDDLLIISFHSHFLQTYRVLRPAARMGFVFWWPWGWERGARRMQAMTICAFFPIITRHMVERAHGMGLKIFAWTPNTPTRIAALRALGVDGVATDFPDRVS